MIHDFLIIGGGIAGASAAAELARLGTTLLLEAEDAFAYHASGRSAALYEPNYGNPVVNQLTAASAEHLSSHDGGYLSPRGLLFVARPEQKAQFEAELKHYDLNRVSPAEAQGMIPILDPDSIMGGGYHESCWDIDTDRLVQGYLKTARQHGAKTLTRQRVHAITREADHWRVTTPDSSHQARHIVNAGGAWADQIASLAAVRPAGITPLRRSMARIPAPEVHDISTWPMLIGSGETWYAKADAGALIISPAEEDPVAEPHDAWADDMVLAEGIARFQEHTNHEVTRLLASWAGLRSFAPDRSLVLGRDTTEPSFIWCAGQGGYGFQTAPGAARLLADLIAGRASEFDATTIAALDPGRFS